MHKTPMKIEEIPTNLKGWLERLGYATSTIKGHTPFDRVNPN